MGEFGGGIQYPTVIIGLDEPESFLFNQNAFGMLEQLGLAQWGWQAVQPVWPIAE